MTNGAHRVRVRVRAWHRELAAAPRYVGNELAGTRQAAAHHHQTAALRAAEAGHATNPADQARLQQEAADARALADSLDQRATELEERDAAYLRHRVHTAVSRAHSEISQQILTDRHADDEPEQHVTAEEWLAAHRVALADDEHTRPVTEDDLDDTADLDQTDAADPRDSVEQVRDPDPRGTRVETTLEDAGEPDLREVAAAEPLRTREDETRVPTADEMADSLDRARRVLHEIAAREAYDHRAEEDERAAQLDYWHTNDQYDDLAAADLDDGLADDGPAAERDPFSSDESRW